MNKEVLRQYEELKRNKKIINTIEPDFFFEIVDYLLQENEELKKELKKKDKQIERYQNMLVTNDLLHIKESQEKDKIIDLMSEQLTTPMHGKKWVKEYYERKAKEV